MKRYLGKASEHVLIRHNDGATTVASWVTRESPQIARDGVLVQQRSALTFDRVEPGDQIEESAGRRWIVIEVETTSSAGQPPIYDVRLGAVEQ